LNLNGGLALKKNKSAIKKARQSEERRLRNSHVKSTMKGYVKKALSAVGGAEAENGEAAFRKAVSSIDKAASKGVIHRNTAARKISRLSKKLQAAPKA
jgi:small subunit ribosomal protein S20